MTVAGAQHGAAAAILLTTLLHSPAQSRLVTSSATTLVVHAGSSRTAYLPGATLQLAARVVLGDPASVKRWQWSAAAPGLSSVSFGAADAQATRATFEEEGVYTLVVDADGSSSSVVVEVYDTTKGAERNFGYNITTLRRFFTHDAQLQFDADALASMRAVSAPPADSGVHPRVLFSPSDLPDIRARLQHSVVGQALRTAIHNRVVRQLTGGLDSKGRFYTKHNRTGKGGSGPDAEGALYDDLVGGSTVSFGNATASLQSNVVGLITYTGLLLQLDLTSLPDGTLKEACAALAGVGAAAAKNIAAALPTVGCSRWQHFLCDYRSKVQPWVYREFMGLGYDMLAPFMSEVQRSSVRQALSLATGEMWSIGMDSLRSPSTGTSNWVPTHMMHLLLNTLAIEGEPGYHPTLLPRLEAAYERFLTDGLRRDGTTFEGMGKDSIWGQMLLALRRRGSLLPALSNVLAHPRDFYLGVTAPHGWTDHSDGGAGDGSFVWDEMDGGSQCASKYADIATLKFLYPDDPRIDFVYRTGMANLTRLRDFNLRFPFKGMEFFVRAITAQDWQHGATTSWAQAQAAMGSVPGANLTNFFNSRGLFAARSDWSTNALRLLFQPRSDKGGHSQFDRTKIALSAHGRWWIPYRPIDKPATIASVVYVNGAGPSTIPVAVRALYDSGGSVGEGTEAVGEPGVAPTPLASFAVSDAAASYSYRFIDHTTHHEEPQLGMQPAFFVANDFLLRPRADDVLSSSLPFSMYPDWNSSVNAMANISMLNASTQVSRAFRTVGLVRGSGGGRCAAASYALVIDDFALNNTSGTESVFTWRAMLATDLSGANASINGADCILSDTLPPENLNENRVAAASGSRLLLRQLRAAPGLRWGLNTALSSHDGKSYPVDSIEANMTGAANFVTLLYPLRPGEALPTTTWSEHKAEGGVQSEPSVLTIRTAAGCVDTLRLAKVSGEPFERVTVSRSRNTQPRLKLDDLSMTPWRTYTGAAGLVLNPERGFRYECQHFPNLSKVQECIVVCKKYNITMLLVTTELTGFHSQPLNATFLRQLDDGYGALRQAGIKAITLFTYFHSYHQELEPLSFDVVYGHIGQLKPVMEKNAGVIAALQAGFLGNDGEWTRRSRTPTSDNNATLLDNISGVVGMLQRELSELVPGRFVLLRTPSDKAFLLRQQPILPSSSGSDSTRAFTRVVPWGWGVAGANTAPFAPFARLGYYDAGFLSTHAGTGSGTPGEMRMSYDGGTWPVTEWGANCSTAKTLADWQSRCPPVEADRELLTPLLRVCVPCLSTLCDTVCALSASVVESDSALNVLQRSFSTWSKRVRFSGLTASYLTELHG